MKPGKPLARAQGESHCYWPPMQALRFFFSITLDKPGLLKALFRVQGPQKLPTVLTPVVDVILQGKEVYPAARVQKQKGARPSLG